MIESLSICNTEIKIFEDPTLYIEGFYLDREIWLNENLSDKDKKELLLHEAVHAIWDILKIDTSKETEEKVAEELEKLVTIINNATKNNESKEIR